jgi:hypothetical protein
MFAIGLWAEDAASPPGSYAAFRDSTSVSGQLTAEITYVVPAECGTFEDWDNVVFLDDLPTNEYLGGPGGELIFGTDGDDHIRGGTGDDCIVARGGDDTVFAIFGFDRVFGGEGDDLIVGDEASALNGGPGDDICFPLASSVNCQQGDVFALTATGHHSVPTIALIWAPIPQAVSYKVHRSDTPQGPFVQIANVSSAAYSDAPVLENRPYYYSVTAVFAPGVESDPSAVRSASVPSLSPTPSPSPSPTPTAAVTSTASPTPLPSTPTSTSTATATAPPATATPAPTRTPTPTAVPPSSTATAVN